MTAITAHPGDRFQSRPCVVTVERVTEHNAYAWCEVCEARHTLDLLRIRNGDGPWRPVEDGSEVQ